MAYNTNLNTLLAAIDGLTEADRFDIANMIWTESFKDKSAIDTHPHFPQVRNGSKIPVLEQSPKYGSFVFTDGNCSLPQCDLTDTFSAYKWQIAQIGCQMSICMDSFSTDFMIFFNDWKRYNNEDINTAIVQFIIERYQINKNGAEWRVLYFGDTASDNALIKGFDGFITQMQARAVAGENLVTITQNSGATAAEQTITSGKVVYDYLVQMYELAVVKPWYDITKMVFRLDRTLASSLVSYLNTTNDLVNCDCIDPNKVVNARVFSIDNLSVFGIPVEVVPFQEIMRQALIGYTAGTGLYENRNIMILARKDNMLIGYELEETLHEFDVFYERKDRKIYINGSSLLGAGVPTDAFIIAI